MNMGCSKHAPHGDWPVKRGNSSLSHCLNDPSLSQTRSPPAQQAPKRAKDPCRRRSANTVSGRAEQEFPPEPLLTAHLLVGGEARGAGNTQKAQKIHSKSPPQPGGPGSPTRYQQGRSPPPSQRLSLSRSARKIL